MSAATTPARPELRANATVLRFEPGLYAMTLHAAGTVPAGAAEGVALPCARLEPVAGGPDGPQVTVVTVPPGGWVDRNTSSAHVLVTGAGAAAVLTIYRASDGAPMPEVRFDPVTPLASPDASGADAGGWLGDPNGHEALEGFSIAPPAGTAASDFEYQGIMGYSWRTPWVDGGAFCGSRGIKLALLGFQFRLRPAAAARLTCRAWGQFEGVGLVGPVGSGEDCFANGAALLAMKVVIEPRAAAG